MDSILVFSTLSDPIVAAAFWTGVAALVLTVLLAVQILVLRIRLRHRDRMVHRMLDTWRPLLNAAAAGSRPPTLPALRRRDRIAFLQFWIRVQFSVRGEANVALTDIALRIGCDVIARDLLQRGQRAQKLLAILVLGHLRDTQSMPQLMKHAGLADPLLSLQALWALVRIDPAHTVAAMMSLCVDREDWSVSRVALILNEAREPSAAALTALLPHLDANRLPRALRLAEALRIAIPSALLDDILACDSVPLLVAALRGVSTPEALERARGLHAHANWSVRVQAVKAVGRAGDRDDIPLLAGMLRDPEWWVRYRAAQALTELPTVSPLELEALRQAQTDRFAQDMLGQAMAEKGLA